MSMLPAVNAGLMGVQKGLAGMRRDAAEIASKSQFEATDSSGLATSLVNLAEHRLQVEASVKVLQTSLDTIGTLLDIKV